MTKTILILVIAAVFVAGTLTTGTLTLAQGPPPGPPSGPVATDVNCATPCIDEAELTFDTANQDELNAHTTNAAAHHGRYTNTEAVIAVGPHTVDTDTQLSEAQVDAFVSNNGFSTGPHTVDTDTQLSEAQVETFITNGAINLDAASTLGSAAISTGPHTTDTTLSVQLLTTEENNFILNPTSGTNIMSQSFTLSNSAIVYVTASLSVTIPSGVEPGIGNLVLDVDGTDVVRVVEVVPLSQSDGMIYLTWAGTLSAGSHTIDVEQFLSSPVLYCAETSVSSFTFCNMQILIIG